jgi:Cft2 family RNA processing exonuclease
MSQLQKNTTFVVDAFNYGKIENITAYFLSHFHSDHYGGITSKFNYGPIYCSKITSNLLIELLKVEEQYVHPLELNKEYIINGVKVTLIDANHCPGAVLFLFSAPIGNNKYFNALHTGDFRASIDQLMNPAIQGLKNSFMDILYLDTTYLEPEHLFPSQDVVIKSVLDVLENIIIKGRTVKEYNNIEKDKKLKNEYHGGLLRYFSSNNERENNKTIYNDNIYSPLKTDVEYNRKKVLVLVGTYLIGKEKVFIGIAKFLKSKIFVTNRKKKILECLNDENISVLITSNPDESCVHIVNMGQLSIENVNNYYNNYKHKYDMVIAFRPTGWVFKPKKGNKNQLAPNNQQILENFNNLKLKPTYYNRNVSIWGIPYSEHSSFVELENFVRVLSSIAPIRDIQPTVNVGNFYGQNEKSRKYWYWFNTWRQNPLMI